MTPISSCQELTNDFGEGVHVDACVGERCQHFLAVPAIGGQYLAERSVIGQRLQRTLGHRVHGEWGRERPDVQDVGRTGILRARAGPQQALRPGAGVEDSLPARRVEQRAVRLVRPLRDRDAELIAQPLRHAIRDRRVPTADEHRPDGADLRIEPRGHAALDAPHEGVGCRQVLLGREEERHVDRDAGEDGLLDGREPFLGSRNLDEQIWSPGPGVQSFGGGESFGRVVDEQG